MDVEQCSNCFELFGFDVLIDEDYKCWLLEVNGSPAIAISSRVDEQVKRPMLNDLIDCIQQQFGYAEEIKNKARKYKKRMRNRSGSVSSACSSRRSEEVSSIDLSDCVESDSDNVFKQKIGGFEQIFPFNAETCEANLVLTNLSDTAVSRAQKFRTIVVKEIKKRRYKKKSKS